MKRINHTLYTSDPDRYELRSGDDSKAPKCPYGNTYKWIGYDKQEQQYVRFTTSVFKQLIKQQPWDL